MKWFWPTIKDEDSALSALMMGVAVSGLIWIAFAIYAAVNITPLCNPVWGESCTSSVVIANVYLIILGGLIFMMRRRSFSFSVSLFVFIGLPMALNGMVPTLYIPAVIITGVLLFQGIRGCYWFHQQSLKERD
ncbi:MAG: hypothetical protein OQJ97_06280 [Rhodospirillales bacterium]|nr:hypothetical protein [Rhodospirillales bacterium]